MEWTDLPVKSGATSKHWPAIKVFVYLLNSSDRPSTDYTARVIIFYFLQPVAQFSLYDTPFRLHSFDGRRW